MLVTIALQYQDDDESLSLDLWCIEAPSVAAVHRLIAEDLGPALRRHGMRRAVAGGVFPGDFIPQAISITAEAIPRGAVDPTAITPIERLCLDLADCHQVLRIDRARLQRYARPGLSRARVPTTLCGILSRHGIRGARGRRLAYRPPAAPSPASRPDCPPF
jgi:hypothetical protein